MTLHRLDPTLTGRLRLALQGGLHLPDDAGPRLEQLAAPTPTAPTLLSRSHASPRERQEAKALYTRCLRHFRMTVQRDAPLDDAALAVAYFVLACLAAARGLQPGEADLAQVERQMRWSMSQPGGWLQASIIERQSAFEQLALLGVLVSQSAQAASTQGRAAQAHVQQAARGYLVQLMGMDADRLSLGAQGLSVELAAA